MTGSVLSTATPHAYHNAWHLEILSEYLLNERGLLKVTHYLSSDLFYSKAHSLKSFKAEKEFLIYSTYN